MKHELSIVAEFGPQLADGTLAARFRQQQIEPYLGLCDQVVLDFTNVRNANSSFINALVAGTLEQHGQAVLGKLVFKGCNAVIRVLVQSAIELGLEKSRRVDV
ncbi:MAG: STAS-like domain-containing protein [Verrucomicrobia bacterium]|nr:STAS-like domain-containing protein [Verrucomicrobiota bacterium]